MYALIGVGMTLIMGVMGIINLAHGELMMVAMYITFWAYTLWGMDPYLSLLLSVPLMFLLGVLIQRYLIRPVLKVDSILPENQVILTVGIGMVLSSLATVFFSSNDRTVEPAYAQDTFYLSDYWSKAPIELSAGFPGSSTWGWRCSSPSASGSSWPRPTWGGASAPPPRTRTPPG